MVWDHLPVGFRLVFTPVVTPGTRRRMSASPKTDRLLGDVSLEHQTFAGLDRMFEDFSDARFVNLNARQRYERICRSLLKLIEDSPKECFLLPAFADFLDKVTRNEVLASSLNQTGFEMWLNLISNVDDETNYRVRARVAGKYLPRTAYQNLFPIGMDNFYTGSHFVTAHNPPDLDTTTASFWGWLDAFAARVGENVHIWNLPLGEPGRTISVLFDELLGHAIFRRIAKAQTRLTMVGRDLVTRKNLIRKHGHETIDSVDHERYENAVIVIDDQGFYQGDWRSSDVEGVRQVLRLMNDVLQAFENRLMLQLIHHFADEQIDRDALQMYVADAFQVSLGAMAKQCHFNDKQIGTFDCFLRQVLDLPGGIDSSIDELGGRLDALASSSFKHLRSTVDALLDDQMFEGSGYLREDRTKIFNCLQDIYVALDKALDVASDYLERLDVALNTKRHVLGFPPNYVTTRTNVEEIRAKMGSYTHFTVAYQDARRNLIPVGVIRGVDLRKGTLGTVSLRDFGNFEEINLAPYLQVISVVDHHKTSINTASPPLAIIGDAQSTCVLLAEQAFKINDPYSIGSMTEASIDAQIAELNAVGALDRSQMRILQRLYQRKMAAQSRGDYFVHPHREFAEYLSFLHAILDDTDLLTKVTRRDIDCVAELLNRLKSLLLHREVEIVHFDDLPGGPGSVRSAAKRLLQNADLHSFYRRIFRYREQDVEDTLVSAADPEKNDTRLFEDTKRQNGCALVGQVKLFKSNYPTVRRNLEALRASWLVQSKSYQKRTPVFDLYIQMISTIAGADEAYAGTMETYEHEDELWIWWAETGIATEHVQNFLMGFGGAKTTAGVVRHVEIHGPLDDEVMSTLRHAFPDVKATEYKDSQHQMLVMRLVAGRLNSRKAFISPYLPKLGN